MPNIEFELTNVFGLIYTGGTISFFPCGKKIAFASGNRILTLNINEKKMKNLNYQARSTILSLDIEISGRFIVFVDNSNLMVVFNLSKGFVENKILLKERCFDVKWSPRGNFLALSIQKHIQIWKKNQNFFLSFSNFELCKTFIDHFSDILEIDWSKNGEFFFSYGYDRIVRIFSFRKYNTFLEIKSKNFKKGINFIKFSDKNGELFILTEKKSFSRWKIFNLGCLSSQTVDLKKKNWKKLNEIFLKIPENISSYVWINFYFGILYFGNSNGKLSFFEINKFPIKNHNKNFKLKNKNDFAKPIFNFNIKKSITILSGTNYSTILILGNFFKMEILIYDAEKKKVLLTHDNKIKNIVSFAISYNERLLAIGNSHGELTLCSNFSGLFLLRFHNSLKKIANLEFFWKSSRLILASYQDGTIKMFDLKKCHILRSFHSNQTLNKFDLICVNYKGSIVASSCLKTDSIYLWSVRKGSLVEILVGHKSSITGIIFTKNSFKLISGSLDKSLRIWDLTNIFNKNSQLYCTVLKADQKLNRFSMHPFFLEIALISNKNQILFFDLKNFKLASILQIDKVENGRPDAPKNNKNMNISINFSHCGKFIFLYYFAKKIKIIYYSSLTTISVIKISRPIFYNQKLLKKKSNPKSLKKISMNFNSNGVRISNFCKKLCIFTFDSISWYRWILLISPTLVEKRIFGRKNHSVFWKKMIKSISLTDKKYTNIILKKIIQKFPTHLIFYSINKNSNGESFRRFLFEKKTNIAMVIEFSYLLLSSLLATFKKNKIKKLLPKTFFKKLKNNKVSYIGKLNKIKFFLSNF